MAQRIGILTGGGDCPGLNAVIRAVVRKCMATKNIECLGILRGWRGLMDGLIKPLDLAAVSGILSRGGTILFTSHTNPFAVPDGPEQMLENVKKSGLDAVICVGGEDTLAVASRMHVDYGLNTVSIPKTIDNDMAGTDYSFGFDTTVNIAMEAIDRIHTTAESHDRVMIVEVMGHNAGWIATHAGLAAGADIILIPEKPSSVDDVCQAILSRHGRGKDFSIVVVAEGAYISRKPGEKPVQYVQETNIDDFGNVRLGGVGPMLGAEIQRRIGYQTRVTMLGHIQRGGSPTAFDRVLATRFGVKACELAMADDFGKMVALRGNEIVAVPLADIVSRRKLVPDEFYDVARNFFG